MHAKLHITEQKHFTDYTLNFRLYTIPPTRKHKRVKESHTKNKKKGTEMFGDSGKFS